MNRYETFWSQTKQELAEIPLNYQQQLYSQDTVCKIYQISYQSLYNEMIFGWLLLPEKKEQFPLIIDFIGYMNKIEDPKDFAHWLTIGCGCLVIDNRGQGGKTKDLVPYKTTTHKEPFGRGILDKQDFYFRRLLADSLRTVEIAQQLTGVDTTKIILHGTSQGGGVALLVNAWTDYPIYAAFANVPSHSNLLHRIAEGTGCYRVIHDYFAVYPADQQKIEETIRYFDLQYAVSRIHNPVFASVGSKDNVCPMRDFWVSYHKIQAPKRLTVYWNKGHEGGGDRQLFKELQLIATLLNKKGGINE